MNMYAVSLSDASQLQAASSLFQTVSSTMSLVNKFCQIYNYNFSAVEDDLPSSAKGCGFGFPLNFKQSSPT